MLNRLDVIALGLLTARPRTGYDIRKWLEVYGRTVGYSAQPSQIYRQLASIAARGLAFPVEDKRDNAPDAKLYELTAVGRDAFDAWQRSTFVPASRPLDPDFQLRFTFAHRLSPLAVRNLVRTELAFRREQHERGMQPDPSLLPDDATHDQRQWARELGNMGQQRGRTLMANLIAWLEATDERLTLIIEAGRFDHAGVVPSDRDKSGSATSA